jgi:hypothetical protein
VGRPRVHMRFVRLPSMALALLACTAPEAPLRYELAIELVDDELPFSIAPEASLRYELPGPLAPPEPRRPATLTEALERGPVKRDPMWRVLEEIDPWLSDHTGAEPCDAQLPGFPALSSNGALLALALGTAPVADEHAAVVRVYRVKTGALLGSYWLLRHHETPLFAIDPGYVQKQYCERAAELARLLDGDFERMPRVGGWQNPIREGLPDSHKPWPLVVADGASKDVDATVADIVIASPATQDPALQLRPKAQQCHSTWGQFSTVWATAEISVFTRGPCGC